MFHGWDGAITGIAEASPHEQMPLGETAERYPRHVAAAVERLLESGITGPYGLALGPDQHRRVIETAEHGGYPLLDHLSKILEGPIVWAPGVRRRGRAQPARRRLRARLRPGPLDRLRLARRRRRAPLPRGERQLPRGHARGRRGAEAVIDLRSDTQTKPSPAMREAMMDAPVGDEQKREDPTVVALEEAAAAFVGQEAAVYLPSATMANEIAL